MGNLELIEKLKDNTNISYEEAKRALEKTNWDILEAVVYLEEEGKIEKPSISIYSTNEYNEGYIKEEKEDINYRKRKEKKNSGESFFEIICDIIDKGNNIFLKVGRKDKMFIKLPLTVIVLLVIFTFWIVIPLSVAGLFFEIEFSLESKNINLSKVNHILKSISVEVKKIKKNIRKGIKND